MSIETPSTAVEADSDHTPRTGSTTFITTSGGLLTDELVSKLRQRQCAESAVRPETFTLPNTEPPEEADLEEEIGDTWNTLRERWDDLTMDNELFGMDVSDARTKWILKLFQALDFEPVFQRENLEADGIEANLSHKGWPDGDIEDYGEMEGRTAPILHTVEPGQKLDEKPEDAPRGAKSPHDTLQEFLNASDEHDWAVVTNGLTLRVLRDFYHTYTRGYVEFDLENLFTNRNYGDFRVLYRLCHASRFIEPVVADDEEDQAEIPLEQLYQVALSTGVKVGQDLQENVVNALETLGNGFLNAEIEEALKEGGQDTAEDYYQDLLYVVYRLLFLMFAEQRGMMSQRDSLYTEEYSITKLRERAEQREGGDRNTDLWEGLKATFQLVGEGDERLGVPGYNGGLFDDDNIEYILDAKCPNEKLLSAVDDLTHIEQEGYRQRISYADLGVEEIGAVYESLLEFTPQLAETAIELEDRIISPGSFYLDDRGMERKETGSYYTDPGLVDELIQSALKPVVEDRIDEDASTEVQEQQLLDITVCDPACGSGAFLIAANNFLGQKLAEIRSESLYPDERTIRQARRSVVQHCLYGVDLNPMAVELAKVSLWINSAVEDKPLSFLDHRIKQGNSLLGTTPELVRKGVPVDAFETSKGRDWHKGNEIRKRVREENEGIQAGLGWSWSEEDDYVSLAERLDTIEEERIDDVQEKERLYERLQESEELQRELLVHNIWTASFYWPLDGSLDEYPTPKTIERVRREKPEPSDSLSEELDGLQAVCTFANKIAEEEGFFHWPLEFPAVFKEGGFDCILGNPPWEKVEVEEKEFFAVSAPEIASVDTQSKREELIEDLEDENPELYQSYQDHVDNVESQISFIKNSGQYPLTGQGHANTYALFSELSLDNIDSRGRVGIIVPTGIITDYYTQDFFQHIIETRTLVSLFDFTNSNQFFPDVHSQYKFSLLSLSGEEWPTNEFKLAFKLKSIDDLSDDERVFTLSPEEIELINPNTKNCPVFESREIAELAVDIYDGIGALLVEEPELRNPWGIELKRMFNRADDSNLFETQSELEIEGTDAKGIVKREDTKRFPVYESRYIHQFDHRYTTYEGVNQEQITKDNPRKVREEEKNNPEFDIVPKFWLSEDEYNNKWRDDWHLIMRLIANPENERTVIASIIPDFPTVNTVNHILGCSAEDALLILSALNSIPLDFIARQKIANNRSLNQFIIKQLPVPRMDHYDSLTINGTSVKEQILEDTIKLVYNDYCLEPLASEVGINREPYSYSTPSGEKREDIRWRIDALMAHIYGLTEDDLQTIYDSFRVLKEREKEAYGFFRTKKKVISYFEDMNLVGEVNSQSGVKYE